MKKLKKCPFCGNDDVGVTVASIGEENGDSLYVECSNCGAGGPWYGIKTEENAIKMWNNRP